MLDIKTIEQAQIQEVAEIHLSGWQDGYQGVVPQDYLDGLSLETYIKNWNSWVGEVLNGLIAYKDNQAAGFISFGPTKTRPPGDRGLIPLYSGEIYALYVKKEFWRMGIGEALMKAAASQMIEQKHKSLILWVLKKNKRAVDFYEHMGGERVGKIKKEIGGKFLDESAIGWRDIKKIIS